MVKNIFLILLFLVSVIHLYHSWKDDSKKRKYTKPFLLPLILAYYLAASPSPSIFLIGALVTSWLGDVLLIPKGNKWFVFGGLSFMLTHVLFIIVYAQYVDFCNILWAAVIPATLIYYGISVFTVYTLKPTTPKMMLGPMIFYLLCNSTMNLFSLMQLITVQSKATVIAFIGALLFFISDCTLYLTRYHKNKNLIFKKHFTVMLTYILGELFITIGMVMLEK
jgi:uncharacterized membrane protein YhhN